MILIDLMLLAWGLWLVYRLSASDAWESPRYAVIFGMLCCLIASGALITWIVTDLFERLI